MVLIRPPETATTSPGDLLIEVRGDTILVERFYNGDNDFASPQGRIGRLEFASGETFDLTGAVPLTATDAPQDIVGTIFADTIIGGRGDDRLMGGGGIDVYVFEPGFGNDEIVDYTGANGALIRFGGGIARADIALDRPADSPRTALISVGGDTIRIEEFFLANDSDATSGKIARIEIAGSGPHQPLGPIPVVTVFETVNARDDVLTVEGTRTTALYPLVNDTAPFGQSSMAIESLGIPNIGTVVLGADGAVLYRPPAGFTGVAQFSYTAGDGATGTDQAFVFLDIVEPKARNGMTGVAGADGLFDQQEIALLYEVSLGRAPDLPGLDFWINEVFDKARLTVSEIAQFFYESEEFAALLGTHPDSLSDAAYVEELYTNALDRGQPASVNDPDGYVFWLDVAATGVDRSSLMRFFAISGENVANAGYVDELVQEIEGSWTFG